MCQCVAILDSGGDQGGPHLQEELDHCGVIILGCQVERLLLQVIVPVHHGVQVNQSLAGGQLTRSCGQVEGGLLLDGQGLNGGPALGHQEVHEISEALGRGKVKGSEASLVLGVHKGILFEQELADLHAAAVRSQVEGAPALVVEHVDPGVTLEQHLHTLGVAPGGRAQQRGPAHVVLFVHRELEIHYHNIGLSYYTKPIVPA